MNAPTLANDPPHPKRVEHLWAVLRSDEHGEGVVATLIAGAWYPLIAADEERLEHIRPIAERLARDLKQPLRLVRFTMREEIEVINP